MVRGSTALYRSRRPILSLAFTSMMFSTPGTRASQTQEKSFKLLFVSDLTEDEFVTRYLAKMRQADGMFGMATAHARLLYEKLTEMPRSNLELPAIIHEVLQEQLTKEKLETETHKDQPKKRAVGLRVLQASTPLIEKAMMDAVLAVCES